jgi:hypothetical protein
MAVTIEAGAYGSNTEAFGLFYTNGAWKSVWLTNNASKEKFFSKDFIGLRGYPTVLATLTRYNSTFTSIAFDAMGPQKHADDHFCLLDIWRI